MNCGELNMSIITFDLTDSTFELINSEIGGNRHIASCLSALRNYDEYTYKHSLNVAYYSAVLAGWVELRKAEIADVIKAGLLHDMGKIRIPKEILNKKGKLLPGEYEVIKMHSLYGYRIADKMKGINGSVKSAIIMHHEREDGTGYPFGHTGKKIVRAAKIVAVADVYDAMTSERVYGKKHTPAEAFDMFKAEGGRLFDRDTVSAFIKGIQGVSPN